MQNEPQLSAELPCHLVEKDVYWSLTDADDDYDGYIHLTSVYDGSGMRLSIADVLATALEEQRNQGLKDALVLAYDLADEKGTLNYGKLHRQVELALLTQQEDTTL